MRKINLLHVVHNLVIGGAQQIVKNLALNTDRERFNTMVCSLVEYEGKGEVEPLTEEIRQGGVEVFTMHLNNGARPVDAPNKEKFIRLLKDREVDVVHSHIYDTDLLASVMAKEAGVKAILYSKHDTYKNKPLKTRLDNARMYNSSADIIVATSDITSRLMWSHEFIYPWKIRMLKNPIDTSEWDPAKAWGDLRDELGIPKGAPVVGGVTRFVARKGVDCFIRTCRLVSKKVPDCWFVLAGYGEDEQKLRGLVDSLGIRNFIFTGARRDIPRVLKTFDIYLFTPYWGEGFPMVILEAMSMEKAIVTSNVCSNHETIDHGVTGLMPTPRKWKLAVQSLDDEALADAVVDLIKDPALRDRLGKAARKSVGERFGIVPTMRRLESFYEKILRKKGVWL